MGFEKEGFHCSFDLDLASRLEIEAVAQQLSGGGRDVDAPRFAIFFHTARDVHGVAPGIASV
jgi:hypothetical protein